MFRLDDQKKTLLRTPGVAGVDEAGRGPLAGPVVAAAVILPDGFDLRGLDDSKKLKAEFRRSQFERIKAEALCAYAIVPAEDIDQINILQASLRAMREAIEKLGAPVREALIDGDRVPPGLACKAFPVVKGDATYAAIAAASIVAKEVRDELMLQYSVQYPRYGFHRHMGYGTPEHLSALQIYGPCPIHRKTFARVRDLVEQPCLTLEA